MARASKRKRADVEEAMRSIELGVFDDSSLDTMPLGAKEERIPSGSVPGQLRVRRTSDAPQASHRPNRAAG